MNENEMSGVYESVKELKKQLEKVIETEEKEREEIEKKEKPEITDIIPNDDEAIEKHINDVPDIFVDRYKEFLDAYKENKELNKRFPKDFNKSIRVLPLEEDGEKSLRMVSTDEEKTKNFLDFLEGGNFNFKNEIIEGIDKEKTKEAIKERLKRKLEK